MPDGRVTFGIIAPNASSISISGDFTLVQNQIQPMVKDEKGLWSFTSEPLEAGLYSYWYILDGIPIPDPGNGAIKPGISTTQSTFEVPGTVRQWESIQNVPHGEVRSLGQTYYLLYGMEIRHHKTFQTDIKIKRAALGIIGTSMI